MVSPVCQVKEGSGAYGSTAAGVNVTPGATITIRLADANVDSWLIQCITTDELNVAATIQASLSIDSQNKTATFTAPAAGSSLRFRSKVNGGVGPDGVVQSSYSITFCIYTLSNGQRVVAADETTERGDFGWLPSLNGILRGYTGTSSRQFSIYGDVTTSGNSATTVASYAMTNETLCAFDVIVTAARATNVTKGGRWKRSVVYRRTSSGAPTIVGTLESGTDQETDAGFDVTIDVSSNTVRVRVTGIAANDIHWNAELRVQESAA